MATITVGNKGWTTQADTTETTKGFIAGFADDIFKMAFKRTVDRLDRHLEYVIGDQTRRTI